MGQRVGLRTKAPMMGAAFLFSMSLYVLVRSLQPVAPRVLTVPLSPQNLPERFAISRIPDTVQVLVEGTEEEVRAVDVKRLLAVADLRDAVPGRKAYRVDVLGIRNLPVRAEVLPDAVAIEIERVLERDMPVAVEPYGELPEGSNLLYESAQVDPKTIKVRGPASAVERVASVRAMLDLSLVDAPNREVSAAVEVLGERNRQLPNVEPSQYFVRVRPAVSAAPETKTVLVAPSFAGQPAFGFRVRSFSVVPNQVVVQGSSGAVARLSTIPTEAIDLSGISASKSTEVSLIAPPGIARVAPRRVRVEILIVPAARS